MAAVAGLLTVVGAFAIARFAQMLGRSQYQLQLRATAQAGLADLTTGEVAAARDCIGTLIYNDRGHERVSPEELIRSYFKLLWAIERAGTALSALEGSPKEASAAVDAWAWHLKEIAWNVWLLGVYSSANTLDLDDSDARNRLGKVLARIEGRVQLPGEHDMPHLRWAFIAREEQWVFPSDPSWTPQRRAEELASQKECWLEEARSLELVSKDELALPDRLVANVAQGRKPQLNRAGARGNGCTWLKLLNRLRRNAPPVQVASE